MRSQKTIQMAEIALMSAVLCVLAPFAIPVPVSPVPFSLATFVVYLTAVMLGPKKGTLSVLVYLLLGMAGLPVFSGFSGGIGKLLGPTGGYAIGYVPCALVTGFLAEKGSRFWEGSETRKKKAVWNIAAMTAGTVVCYLFGTVWFLAVMDGTYSLTQALMVCVVPYLVFDIVKIVLAGSIAVPVRKVLKNIGVNR